MTDVALDFSRDDDDDSLAVTCATTVTSAAAAAAAAILSTAKVQHYDPKCRRVATFLGYPCPCGSCPNRTRSVKAAEEAVLEARRQRAAARKQQRPARPSADVMYADALRGGWDGEVDAWSITMAEGGGQPDWYVPDQSLVPHAAAALAGDDHDDLDGGSGPGDMFEFDDDPADISGMGYDGDLERAGFTERTEILGNKRIDVAGPQSRIRAALDKHITTRVNVDAQVQTIAQRVFTLIESTKQFFEFHVCRHSAKVFAPAPRVAKELVVMSVKHDARITYTDDTGASASVYGHGLDTATLYPAIEELWWEYALALIERYHVPLECDRVSQARDAKARATRRLKATEEVDTLLLFNGADTSKAYQSMNLHSNRATDVQTAVTQVLKMLTRQISSPRSLAVAMYIACCRIGSIPPMTVFMPYDRLAIDPRTVRAELQHAWTKIRRLERREQGLKDKALDTEVAALTATRIALEREKARVETASSKSETYQSQIRANTLLAGLEKTKMELSTKEALLANLPTVPVNPRPLSATCVCDEFAAELEQERAKAEDLDAQLKTRAEEDTAELATENAKDELERCKAKLDAAEVWLDVLSKEAVEPFPRANVAELITKATTQIKLLRESVVSMEVGRLQLQVGRFERKERKARATIPCETPAAIFRVFLEVVAKHEREHTKETFHRWYRMSTNPQSYGVGLPISALSTAFSKCGLTDQDIQRPCSSSSSSSSATTTTGTCKYAATSGLYATLSRYNPVYARKTGAGDPVQRAVGVTRNVLDRLHDYFDRCMRKLASAKMTHTLNFKIAKAGRDLILDRRVMIVNAAKLRIDTTPRLKAYLQDAPQFIIPELNGLALVSAMCDPRYNINDCGAWFPWDTRLYSEMAGRFVAAQAVEKRVGEIHGFLGTGVSVLLNPTSVYPGEIVSLYQQRCDHKVFTEAVAVKDMIGKGRLRPAAKAATAVLGSISSAAAVAAATDGPVSLVSPSSSSSSVNHYTVSELQVTKRDVSLPEYSNLTRLKAALVGECKALLCQREPYLRTFHVNVYKIATHMAFRLKAEKNLTSECVLFHAFGHQRAKVERDVQRLVYDQLKHDAVLSSTVALHPESALMKFSRQEQTKVQRAVSGINKRKAQERQCDGNEQGATTAAAASALRLLEQTGSTVASTATAVMAATSDECDNFAANRASKRCKTASCVML